MQGWQETFADRLVTADEAVAQVRSGDLVVTGLPEPTEFLLALAAARHASDVSVFAAAPRIGGVAAAENPALTVLVSFRTQYLRKSGAPCEVLPVRLQDWGGLFERLKPRVSIVPVATPSADGTVCPGSVVAGNDALVRRDRGSDDLVFGFVNPVLPHIRGESYHVDDFDGLIAFEPSETSMPIYDDRRLPDHLDEFVAALDELIPDGATIQAGVGGIAEAALRALTHKVDLGVHTEVLGPGVAHLIESGVATGRHKTVFPDEAVFTISMPETYEMLDGNPSVRIAPARSVLDPAVVAANRDMRCINSALEVDLFGQVNAEMIGGEQYSGVGGQLDFLRGCSLSNDALAIHVLPSTAANGTVSRIVGRIEGNAVTGTRYDTQAIVTEYGIAHLRDATMRQKAERLIAIAHPDHRDALARGLGSGEG